MEYNLNFFNVLKAYFYMLASNERADPSNIFIGVVGSQEPPSPLPQPVNLKF